MWKCNINNSTVKLYRIECILNPVNGFRYLLFHCTFGNGAAVDVRDWHNDCIKSSKGLQAVCVLIAWTISFEKGSCVSFEIVNEEDKPSLILTYIDFDTNSKKKLELKSTDMPRYIREAIDIVLNELQYQYGRDNYLDI